MTLGLLLTTIAPGVVMLPIPSAIAQTSPATQKTGANTLRASETEQLFQQGIQHLNRKQYNSEMFDV
ncbi:MAG: hypothetical protein B0A82_26575 [Alkalinema sp. CACIAM 70d]|nr:MAG: hypothetical protein B0A82_26575 [Alkalinema sp. CACIAM 70d]